MPSTRVVVLPWLASVGAGHRVDQEAKAVVAANATQAVEMEDITDFVEYFYSRPGLMRCCCEASYPEGTSWYHIGTSRDATRCNVHFSECADVTSAETLYHYSEVGGRCIVPIAQTEELAKLVFDTMGGSAPTYCKAIGSSNADDERWWREMRPQGHPGVHFVRPARYGQTVTVHCEDEGYNPEHSQSTCGYVEVSYGLFDPTPACTPQPGWCQRVRSEAHRLRMHDQVIITATSRAGWICHERGGMFSVCHANSAPRTHGVTRHELQQVEGPAVPIAARGERAIVECPAGYEPKERVTCGRDHTFEPEPECEKVAAWCRGFDVRRVHVEPLAIGEPGAVRCPPGFRPSVEFVWCDADRELSAVPECEMVPDYCPEIDENHPHGSPHMHVEARGVHQSAHIECAHGYILGDSVQDAICGEDGNFHPTPQCIMDPYFCNLLVQGEQGELGGFSVRAAGINQESAVQCDQGYLPQLANVSCGDDGFFSPAPVCPKDPAHCSPVGVDVIIGARAPPGPESAQVRHAAALGELQSVECGDPLLGPKDSSVECGVSGRFRPLPECRLECSALPTQLAGGCTPYEHAGACFTHVGDGSGWRCWERGAEQDDHSCMNAGFGGACWYADYSNTVASCSEKGYNGQCGTDVDYWGACYVEGSETSAEPGAWACIEDPQNAESESRMVPLDHYLNGRCRVLALPIDLSWDLAQETYSNVCTFP